MDGLLEPYGDVTVLAPSEFTPEAVAEADAMFIRTRTRCNRGLLGDSPRCRFIGTATIGFDHIDLEYCRSHGITAVNAPGCNAPAVAQYVFSAIANVINRPVDQYVLGIVGVGHVGRIVEAWARSLGMKVMLCDPPRQRAEGGEWSTLGEIAAAADIITFHTPLTRTGADATFHLADSAFFDSLRRAPVIINASRGPVVDTGALIAALDSGQVHKAVIDVWEGEPDISRDLLRRAAIATPHIAGYSRQGKVRATRMVLDAFSEKFGLPHIAMREPLPGETPTSVTLASVARTYDILADDASLRANPGSLESLRDNYPLRDEQPAVRSTSL